MTEREYIKGNFSRHGNVERIENYTTLKGKLQRIEAYFSDGYSFRRSYMPKDMGLYEMHLSIFRELME